MRTINPEKKEKLTYLNPNLYNATIATQSTVSLINGVAVGTLLQERVGRKIRHHGISINIQVLPRTTGMTNPDCGFIAILLDRQPNSNLATFGDMYDLSPTGVNLAILPRNTNVFQERFKVLYTKEWHCPSFANGDAVLYRDYVDLSKLSGPDATTNFDGNGAGIADINSGALLLVTCQNNVNQTVSGAMDMKILTKYRFTDI